LVMAVEQKAAVFQPGDWAVTDVAMVEMDWVGEAGSLGPPGAAAEACLMDLGKVELLVEGLEGEDQVLVVLVTEVTCKKILIESPTWPGKGVRHVSRSICVHGS
jgi:hypothetical protein